MKNFKTGKFNKLTDVKGVSVGHYTLADGDIQTGVTVIMPSEENPFLHKLPAATYVINGFGKTAGLMQIDELGTLESPIALTNTLAVGRVHYALVDYMIERCQQDNYDLESINVVVGECNDCRLNKIAKQSIVKEQVLSAINEVKIDFELGAVGAGRGMVCHQLKGGIGSASRIVTIADKEYTLGALVLANHGKLHQLTIKGQRVGKELISAGLDVEQKPEKGSIMVIIATDAPLTARQIKRVCKRAAAGIARVGSEFGNGSGDVVIGFSTANMVKHQPKQRENSSLLSGKCLYDDKLDALFSATVEAVEDSVISALNNAESVKNVLSLKAAMEEFG